MRAVKLTIVFAAACLFVCSCGAPGLSPFQCSTAENCDLRPGGMCEAYAGSSWCSYGDPSCTSGRRWSEQAASSIAGVCVGEEPTINDAAIDTGDASDNNLVPVFVQKLDAGTSASNNDLFGATVAIDGDVAVISAMTDAGASESGSGSVFVYERANGTWSYFQTLSVGSGMSYRFGRSVAVSGDIIVIGAPNDAALGSEAGTAYVFRRGANVWSQQVKLTATDGAAYDHFGTAVAVAGNVIAVGAPDNDVISTTNTGSVYLFEPTGAGGAWTEVANLVAGTDAAMNLQFGYAVAVAPDTVAVGSQGDLVQVHERVGASWTRTGRVTPSTVSSSTSLDFGTVVDIDGQHMVIGAPSMTMTGEVHVFERAGNWATNHRKLTVSDNTSDAAFGSAVAIAGGHVLVGSNLAGSTDAGAAYFFQRRTDGYDEAVKLTATDGSAGDWLGFSAAMSATELLVGAAADDEHGNLSGSAYLWHLD